MRRRGFSLQRVDIASSNPLRFTEVIAALDSLNIWQVPEPATLILMSGAFAGLGYARRHCTKRTTDP